MSSSPQPSRLFTRLLLWWTRGADVEDLLGDLQENFELNVASMGAAKAQWVYIKQTLSLLFSYSIKKRKKGAALSPFFTQNPIDMLINYIKIAYRNLRKQLTFTTLNVIGLSIGMSVALLAVAMYVDLKKFDTFHKDAEHVYRVTTLLQKAGDKEKYSSAPPALTRRMKSEIPAIYKSVHVDPGFGALVNHKGNNINVHGYFTEPSFFEVFDFDLASGSPEVLANPGQVLLTKELSEKLFGNQDAIGRVIETEQWGSLQVGGVLDAFPKHTHLTFELLVGFATSDRFNAQRSSEWTEFTSNYFYFAVADEELRKLEAQMKQIGSEGNSYFAEEAAVAEYGLQPLLAITPGELINDGIGVQFDMPTMLLFFGIALLILLPACLNYTNMSIALALQRAKEVGIRKVMGSQKRPIIHQFLVETVIICLVAMSLSSVFFVYSRQMLMDTVIGGSALTFEVSPALITAFVGFALMTGLLTGLAPALYFAKISPMAALRPSASQQKINISGIRKGLMVFQFALTLVFMIGTGSLFKQYLDTQGYELPFDVDQTYVIYTQDTDPELLQNYLLEESKITGLSFSSSIPGTSLSKTIFAYDEQAQDSVRLREVLVSSQFVDHMNLNLQWGQPLSDTKHQIDHVIVNRAMMDLLHRMQYDTSFLHTADDQRYAIVGVIEDYNHEPLNQRIEPMLLRIDPTSWNYALVTVPGDSYIDNYELLESRWEALYPDLVFKASLLKNEIYDAYFFFRIGLKIYGFLALLALSISCLGLLGMVIYTSENRTKEVAIRKILGASISSLFGSLAQLFIKLWAIALLIAVPASYYFYDNFLIKIYNKFGDGVGLMEILISVLITISLGALVIFWQVNKVARINPAENLRYE